MSIFSSCCGSYTPIPQVTEEEILDNKVTRLYTLSPTISSLWKAVVKKYGEPIQVAYLPHDDILWGIKGTWHFDVRQGKCLVSKPKLTISKVDEIEPLIASLYYLLTATKITNLAKRAYCRNISLVDFVRETCPNLSEVHEQVTKACEELSPHFAYRPTSECMTFHTQRMSHTWNIFTNIPGEPRHTT